MEAGEILLRKGLLNQRQLQLSREAQVDGTRLDQAAVQLGFLSEEKALRALGEEVGMELIALTETGIDLSLPQDGRIQLKVAGREVDVRVSVIPMIHGEGIVMRLLDKGGMDFSLSKLGMEDDPL